MEEYGGYLPYEYAGGKEYYTGEDVVALNCARNAIVYAFRDGEYDKLFVPFYMCGTVFETLQRYKIVYQIYHMDEEFHPINVKLKRKECILYPNYYGLIADARLDDIVKEYHNVIFDNTQAFFASPIMEAYNVYSCRKFIGVCDGAYVIKSGIKHVVYEEDKSSQRLAYLFESIEAGTDFAYAGSLEMEKELSESPIRMMSRVTHKMLGMANYQEVITRRKNNYDMIYRWCIDEGVKGIRRPDECVPMIYPFFCEDIEMRSKLIENHIYIPQWWKYLLCSKEITAFERELIEKLLPLPIDQRYELADIVKMLEKIGQLLKRKYR